MKLPAGTPMVVSSCEPPRECFFDPTPNNDMRDYDSAARLDRFVRCGLAGNAQQRAPWEFSRVAPAACVPIASVGLE